MTERLWIRPLTVSFAILMLLMGCGGSKQQGDGTGEEATARVKEEVAVQKLDGCLCRLDEEAKIVEIAPLKRDEEDKPVGFDASAMQSFGFDAGTKITGGEEALTVKQVNAGSPISDDIRTLAELAGNKVSVAWVASNEKRVLTQITVILAFAGESFAGLVGADGPTAIYWSTKCSCGSE